MDLGNDYSLDPMKLINIVGNGNVFITPHKIAVVAFIREYGLLKNEAKHMVDCTMAPKYRKDFCILALKLIQCPDMEFKELEALLTDGRYNLLSVHLQNFCVRLQNIYVNGISALMDCVTSTVDKLMIQQTPTNLCTITRCSVLGFYLRRIMLQMDQLTFVQVVSLYKSFCIYYQKGRPGLMMRSLSKEKLNNMESQGNTASVSPTEETKHHELSMKINVLERDNGFDEGQWSRKQAELLTAQQANLIEINEKKAMPPRQLQKTITQIMHDVPEYPDVHFLSFLNCLRVKEYSGAQDSLHNCYDRSVFNVSSAPGGERNKNFRYAALNRAAMHTHFGHKEVALESLSECMQAAQEAGDAACLAEAAAWRAGGATGGAAGGAAGGAGVRRAAARLAGARPAAAAAQRLAQHVGVHAATPASVFQIITKGDTINYLHSMTDLTLAGLANTAALWALYGKTEMASVTCQLILNLNTKSSFGNSEVWQCSGGWGTGVAGVAAVAAWRADHALDNALSHSHLAAASIAVANHAAKATRAGKWEEADQSIRQLASFNRWESQLLKGEMYFLKGEATDALETLQDVLDYCLGEEDSLHYMPFRIRALMLIAEIHYTFSNIQSSNMLLLEEALSAAKKYHLHYLAATAEMHIANVELQMGRPRYAMQIVRKVLPTVMAHGSSYDMGRALVLYAKCRIGCAPESGESRPLVLNSCCETLDAAKKHFARVGAHHRLMHTWYLQAQLYNDMGNMTSRNQCAWMYRQLETQNPVENANMLLIMY